MIYCFGDSHVGIFSGRDEIVPIWPERSPDLLPWFRTIRVGAVTAYNAHKHIETIKSILPKLPEFNKKQDTLLLVFGEVDIRMHVYIQVARQQKPMEEIVHTITERYFQAVETLLLDGFTIALYGCAPSFIRKDFISASYGDNRQRNEATLVFNRDVWTFCKDKRIRYVSVFNELLLPGSLSDLRYMDSQVMGEGNGLHLTTKVLPLLLWKCRDIGLIPFEDAFLQCEAGNYRLEQGNRGD